MAPGVLDPDTAPPEFLADLYGEVSPDEPEHYPIVVAKLDQMHAEGPALTVSDLSRIETRTLGMMGDDDEVTLEHAIELYRSLPTGELAVIPGTSHGLLVEKPELCNTIIIDFLEGDPGPTMAPIRRPSNEAAEREASGPAGAPLAIRVVPWRMRPAGARITLPASHDPREGDHMP